MDWRVQKRDVNQVLFHLRFEHGGRALQQTDAGVRVLAPEGLQNRNGDLHGGDLRHADAQMLSKPAIRASRAFWEKRRSVRFRRAYP